MAIPIPIVLEKKLFDYPKGRIRPRKVMLAEALVKVLEKPKGDTLTMEEAIVLYEELEEFLPYKLVPFVKSWLYDRGEHVYGSKSYARESYIGKVPKRNPRFL